MKAVAVGNPRRVVFPETYEHPPTVRRVKREIENRVDLPPDKTVVIKEAGAGERLAIPQRFASLPAAVRVRDEIRDKVDLPPGKTVVLHTPRAKRPEDEGPPVAGPADKLEQDVERAIAFGTGMLDTPYGTGWREGTWPALSSLYSRITEHDPAAWYRQRACICAGFVNVVRFEVAGLPSVGWDQGDGWPGGTAAIWRHLAFAPGSLPYPPVENTPRGWLVVAPYMDARFVPFRQGHVGIARGDGRVVEARVPELTNGRTEDEGDRWLRGQGARGYERIVPPEIWLRK